MLVIRDGLLLLVHVAACRLSTGLLGRVWLLCVLNTLYLGKLQHLSLIRTSFIRHVYLLAKRLVLPASQSEANLPY